MQKAPWWVSVSVCLEHFRVSVHQCSDHISAQSLWNQDQCSNNAAYEVKDLTWNCFTSEKMSITQSLLLLKLFSTSSVNYDANSMQSCKRKLHGQTYYLFLWRSNRGGDTGVAHFCVWTKCYNESLISSGFKAFSILLCRQELQLKVCAKFQ